MESGGGNVPVDHVVEWLAEWCRESRRRQRGLLLLTGYRAKGLEFDHIAVLNGGWERAPDAARTRTTYAGSTTWP